MATIRTKFTADQAARLKARQRENRRGLPGGEGAHPLVKILIVTLGVFAIYILGAVLLYTDYRRFVGDKPLPMPTLTAIPKAVHEELGERLRKCLVQKKPELLTIADLNGLVTNSYDPATLPPGEAPPTAKAEVYATDSKGNLVVLISFPFSDEADAKHFTAVLLFAPQGPGQAVLPGQPAPPRELKLTKIHAGGKPLSEGETARIRRLVRVVYQRFETLSGEMYTKAQERGLPPPSFAGDPDRELSILYGNATLYFNGFEP